MRRYLVDENLAALAERAVTESAYRLGGAYRGLRGVRPPGRRVADLATVAVVAGVFGAVVALSARRLLRRLVELIDAMEAAELMPDARTEGPVGPSAAG